MKRKLSYDNTKRLTPTSCDIMIDAVQQAGLWHAAQPSDRLYTSHLKAVHALGLDYFKLRFPFHHVPGCTLVQPIRFVKR